VTATIPVGQAPDQAAVNPRTDTIYLTNFQDNTVSVISGRTDTVTATIPVGTSPIGVAADPRTSRIYVSNSADNTISVISGQTNTVVAAIAMGPGVFALQDAVNPRTSKLYVINEDSVMPVINVRTDAVITTVDLSGSEPGGIAVNPKTNTIYVTNAGDNTVSVLRS
jgi:YVTN family beta-propeller protein